MNKEVVKVIPNCIEKLGKLTPAKLREFRKFISDALEEKEREDFSRLKISKKQKEK